MAVNMADAKAAKTSEHFLKSPKCLTAFYACLVLASFSCSIAALSCTWWEGSLDFAGIAGVKGDFTLWGFRSSTSIGNVVTSRLHVSLSDFCAASVFAFEQQICDKIRAVRMLIFAGFFFALFALTSTVVAHYIVKFKGQLEAFQLRRVLLATLCLTLASGLAVFIGLCVAASVPGSKAAQDLGVVGAGVYASIIQLLCCIIATILIGRCWCKTKDQWKEQPSSSEANSSETSSDAA
eukprot:TRINITY_DN2234_c2_g1_i1.p1 TRINITY_DN2234_c2_g1~~TRINITY_DN2234_c2_g1_i1.p1  ORF type:complete len:237 (+),score=37.02 TRINITY_DN2234_c2_g1_i1:97-807(+)